MSAQNCRNYSQYMRRFTYIISSLKGIDPVPKRVGHVDHQSQLVTSIEWKSREGEGAKWKFQEIRMLSYRLEIWRLRLQ